MPPAPGKIPTRPSLSDYDQRLGKERPREFGRPLDKARPPRERIRCRREDLLQRLGQLCYRGHREAPLSSKVVYTFMMPKWLPSAFLRLMHMGNACAFPVWLRAQD